MNPLFSTEVSHLVIILLHVAFFELSIIIQGSFQFQASSSALAGAFLSCWAVLQSARPAVVVLVNSATGDIEAHGITKANSNTAVVTAGSCRRGGVLRRRLLQPVLPFHEATFSVVEELLAGVQAASLDSVSLLRFSIMVWTQSSAARTVIS